MKFIITEEEKNQIRNLYNFLNEGPIDKYLAPSPTTSNSETLLGYLKSVGVNDIITFKKNCLSKQDCYFSKKEIKKLTPVINNNWDVLADKCWECYGGPITYATRTNETMTKKFEELKPYCQTVIDDEESKQCRYELSGNTKIIISLDTNENGVIYAFAHGYLTSDFLKDTNNQNVVNGLKPYGNANPSGNFLLNKEIKDLKPIIDVFKNLKTT